MKRIDTTSLTPAALEAFFRSELASQPVVRANYAALAGVRVKSIDLGDRVVRVQYNPAREVSASVKVDAAAISRRRCFLCRANRPEQQGAVDIGEYELLVNPFPIFPRHFTVSAIDHVPQSISGRIGHMIVLALSMPGYTVFYNGARCGASAPDHMHFQAVGSDFMNMPPVNDCAGMPYFRIDAVDAAVAEASFVRLLSVLPSEHGEEPMINVLCKASPREILLYVIPRAAHRPDFYGTADGQMLISPASVDLGGMFVLPRKVDFDRIDAGKLRDVVEQVCISAHEYEYIRQRLDED